MTPRAGIVVVTAALLSLAAGSGHTQDAGEDLITLRDGSTKAGKVESCDAAGCLIGGSRVARTAITSIRLGRQGVLNLQDAAKDEIQLTDGSVLEQTMTSVDAAGVASNQDSFPRNRVAWIYLAPRRAVGPRHRQGSFVWMLRQNVPAGPQNWDGKADLTLNRDEQGAITGMLEGNQTQTLELAHCHATTNGTVKATLQGTATAEEMNRTITDAGSVWPELTPCREGNTAHTGASVLKWPHLTEAFQHLSSDSNGGFHYDREWPMPMPQMYPYTIRYVLDLRPGKP